MTLSQQLRNERRAKSIKTLYTHTLDIIKIGLGVVVGIGMLWIIQVGVTLIFS